MTVTDANSTAVTFSATVNEADSLLLTLVDTSAASCSTTSGSISAIIHGGTQPFSYTLNGSTTVPTTSNANSWAWANGYGGSGSDAGAGNAVDADNNVYSVGYFDGSATFGSTTLTGPGLEGYFTKHDSDGNLLWVKHFSGGGSELGSSISITSGNEIVVLGRFVDSLKLNDSLILQNPAATSGGSSMFLLRFDASGTLIWAQYAGETGFPGGHISTTKVVCDVTGNSYVTGYFEDDVSFSGSSLSAAAQRSTFIAKYNASGTLVWLKSIQATGFTGRVYPSGLAISNTNEILLCGSYRGTATFGSTALTSTNTSSVDIFTAKYDSNGNFQWVETINGAGNDSPTAIDIDDQGIVYVTGAFSTSPLSIGSFTLVRDGGSDGFLIKYTSSGDIIWAKNLGTGAKAVGRGLYVISPTHIVVSGNLEGSGTFDGIALASTSFTDIYLIQTDSSGTAFTGIVTSGTLNNNIGGNLIADGDNNVFVSGSVFQDIAFGPHQITGGNNQAFIAKYITSGGLLFDSLAGGAYTVIATDSLGCSANLNVTVPGSSSSTVSGSVAITSPIACAGDNNGVLTASATGGTSPYSFIWSNGDSTAVSNGLGTGTYTVTITDSGGCTGTIQSALLTSALLAVSGLTTPETGSSNGAINITTTGGTSPYSYAWSNGSFNEDQTGLSAGTYTVTITDFHLCSIVDSFTVLGTLNLSGTTTDVSCAGESTGSVNLSVSGGTLPYSFLWSNGAITEDLSGLAGGTYTVTVTDAVSTTASQSYTVTQPQSNAYVVLDPVDISCFGANNGKVDLTVVDTTLVLDTVDIGTQTGTWTNTLALGYKFIAPFDFVITRLRVPQISTDPQYLEVVRFFSASSPFNTSLYYGDSIDGNGFAEVNIPVTAGQTHRHHGCTSCKPIFPSAEFVGARLALRHDHGWASCYPTTGSLRK